MVFRVFSTNILQRIFSNTVHFIPMIFVYTDATPTISENNKSDPEPDSNYVQCVSKEKYWTAKTISELINIADKAYIDGQYLEVYELLNRLKYSDNGDVQWRIARTLYKLSNEKSFPTSMRKIMIDEAYDLLNSINTHETNPNIYKWLAIILDSKNCLEGIDKQVSSYPKVRELLNKAIQLNPEDSTSYYILGKWCFNMSQMSWIQKLFTRLIFGPVPDTSFQEAYEYLLKCYQLRQDNYYIPIMYMLGETCYRLKQYFRAEFYLKNAVILQPRTKFEYECLSKSRRLLDKLELYNLTKEAVLFEYPFKF